MSILRTYNIQNPDSESTNIELSANGGIAVAGIITATSGVVVTGIITATTFDGNVNATSGITTFTGLNASNVVITGVTTVSAGSTSAPSITPSGDSNTGVFFPDVDTIAFAEGGSEAVRIDSSGRLLVGTSSARTDFFNAASTYTPRFQLEGSDASGSTMMSLVSNNSAGLAPYLVFALQKSGSPGGDTVVADGNELGHISFQGNDGSEMVSAASITSNVDGTPGPNDMPGRLVFSTTADGASSPTERMRIQAGGRINTYSEAEGLSVSVAGTTNLIFIGKNSGGPNGSGNNQVFIYNDGDIENTNNSYGPIASDERLKQDIVDASSQWDDIKNVRIAKFRYKNDPTGYLQLGPIAQELEQVSPGLVTRRPASEEEVADPSNGLVDGDEVLSFKASILYMKAVKALQEAMERIETLEAEVAALKGA